MKIQYKDKLMELDKPITINELLKEEIENSEATIVAAIFNNEYKNLESMIQEDGKIELNGKKIICSCDSRNTASAKLQQSCGLKYSYSKSSF